MIGQDFVVLVRVLDTRIVDLLFSGSEDSREEVPSAKEFAVPGKALVLQLVPTLAAGDTLWMPGLIRDVEEVAIEDRLITTHASDHLHHPIIKRETSD